MAHDDSAIGPAEASPSPMTDNSNGAGHELEQGMEPVVSTTMRSHPVVEGDPESGDTVGLRAKMEPTVRRAEQAPGSPEECGARAQKDIGTRGGARLAESRPPDDGAVTPGGRAVSAQSPTGTVMGLLSWRRSLAGVGWIAFRQGGSG